MRGDIRRSIDAFRGRSLAFEATVRNRAKTKPLTVAQLLADFDRIIDEVIATGRPCRVIRRGRTVVIRAVKSGT